MWRRGGTKVAAGRSPGKMSSVTWRAPERPRTNEPFTGPERQMLGRFLD